MAAERTRSPDSPVPNAHPAAAAASAPAPVANPTGTAPATTERSPAADEGVYHGARGGLHRIPGASTQ